MGSTVSRIYSIVSTKEIQDGESKFLTTKSKWKLQNAI